MKMIMNKSFDFQAFYLPELVDSVHKYGLAYKSGSEQLSNQTNWY